MPKSDIDPKVSEIKQLYSILKKSRLVLNWDEFSQKINYDRTYISRVMNGHEPLTEELENAIEKTFGRATSNVSHETNVVAEGNIQQGKGEEIFLNGPIKLTAQEYVDALKSDKKKLEDDKKQLQRVIDLNLEAMQQLLSSLSRHDRAYHETILMSLARLEKRPSENDLIVEAGTREISKLVEEQNKHNEKADNFRKKESNRSA